MRQEQQTGRSGTRESRNSARFKNARGGLNAEQKAQFDRLLNAKRITEADEDDEPQMFSGRLN